MTTEIEDTVFGTLNRLNGVRSQPPIPLAIHIADHRQRDHPAGRPGSFRGRGRRQTQSPTSTSWMELAIAGRELTMHATSES